MIGRVGSSQDSSFLCLLAIYAIHLLLFHVLDVTPLTNTLAQPKLNRSTIILQNIVKKSYDNGTAFLGKAHNEQRPAVLEHRDDLLIDLVRHQMSASSSSSKSYSTFPYVLGSYSKINFEHLYAMYSRRMRNVFTNVALNSSTWGIIGGCAIFILT